MATEIASINREITVHSITENVKILVINKKGLPFYGNLTDHQMKNC
jgi:hypothetical protein